MIIPMYICNVHGFKGFPGGSDSRESACNEETQVQSLDWEDPLENGTVAHSSILACRVSWIEEPGGLQSMGSQRVGHSELLTLSP